jgi:uncharacterized protein (DUF1501 family)
MSMDRRDFVQSMCAGGIATFGMPTVRFAHVRTDARLVFVLLRGGVDGLATIVPYGDPAYAALRGPLAYPSDALTPLNDLFALAPGLAPLHDFWERGELAAIHAMAIPFRTRSHFDGQAVLETGLDRPVGSADGWLNRLLQVMPGQRAGIAVAAGLPRSLSGPFEVRTWSPAQLGVVSDAYLERLAAMYREDPILSGRFEAAIAQQSAVGEEMAAVGGAQRGGATPLFQATARLMLANGGPNVAAVEFSGWDTHANQGLAGGALDRLLGQLAEGLVSFRTAMGDSWASTTVVVMTEFGRTARPNGTRGTDHGTGGAGFVLGPKLGRGRIISDWPGLSNRALFEGRDVAGTLDTRAVLKGVLSSTFDLTAAQLERVLPGTSELRSALELG